jgi:integrase
VLLDATGRRPSPMTMPGYQAVRPPGSEGMRYPADPPTVDEIVAVMRNTADDRHGSRLRGMIVVLWRAGLRLQEALTLAEHDPRRGSVLVRHGKGGRRGEVGMDEWGWKHPRPWLSARAEPPAELFSIIDGRPWSGAAVRSARGCNSPTNMSQRWCGGGRWVFLHRGTVSKTVRRPTQVLGSGGEGLGCGFFESVGGPFEGAEGLLVAGGDGFK